MSVTANALLIVCFSLFGLAPALAGLYTLLTSNYIIGGRSKRLERVYIYPSSRPGLFILLVGIHVAATCIFSFIIFVVLHST
jgi:hypothetical protein